METIIKNKLCEIEMREGIQIIAATELGPRAWGLNSPNSDHCVRFIYKRNKEDYLRLNPVKDEIDWQPGNTLEISGWDLKKVLQLLNSSHPELFEFLFSPIVYFSTDAFFELKELALRYFSPQKSMLYYWHTASENYKEYLASDRVRIRDYFYVLRPLLAAKYILTHNCLPPVEFSKLMGTEFPAELREEVLRLQRLKRNFSELVYALKIVVLNEYIESVLDELKKESLQVEPETYEWDELNQFFLKQLQ